MLPLERPPTAGVRARPARARATPSAGRSRAAARRRSPMRWPPTCDSLGGKIETGREVRSLADLPDARAVLFDVTPRQLVAICGDELPPRYRSALGRYRYGPGVFKVDYALVGAGAVGGRGVPAAPGRCTSAARSTRSPPPRRRSSRGGHPERPFVLVAQQSLVDPDAGACGTPHAVGVLPRPERLDGRHDRGDRAPDRAVRPRLRRRRARARRRAAPLRSRPTTPTTSAATSTAARPTCARCSPARCCGPRPYATPNPRSSCARRRRRRAAVCTACAATTPRGRRCAACCGNGDPRGSAGHPQPI